eukprot:1436551-Pyramimonas_sp.AAC.1
MFFPRGLPTTVTFPTSGACKQPARGAYRLQQENSPVTPEKRSTICCGTLGLSPNGDGLRTRQRVIHKSSGQRNTHTYNACVHTGPDGTNPSRPKH